MKTKAVKVKKKLEIIIEETTSCFLMNYVIIYHELRSMIGSLFWTEGERGRKKRRGRGKKSGRERKKRKRD